MHIIAILQARASSTRLPNKVLRPILGEAMLSHQIKRTLKSELIDQLIVATSTMQSDDGIVNLASALGVACYRGSLDDVLDRFYQAAHTNEPTHVVRLTGDCPLADSAIIDNVIQHHLDTGADYTSNVCPPSFPDGLDVEVMTFKALEAAWQSATLASDREHVTSYIRKPEAKSRIENVVNNTDLSHLRWTVDEQEDFEFVSRVYERLYQQKPSFDTDDVLQLLQAHPSLMSINQGFARNEGYSQSLLKESK